MKIALLNPLPDPARTSMQVYHRNLAKNLRPFLGPHDSLSEDSSDGVSSKPGLSRYLDQYWHYGQRVRKMDADIFHVTDHGYVHLISNLKNKKTVLTFHDALLPALSAGELPVRWRPRLSILTHRQTLKSAAGAGHVLAVSEFSKNEFLKHVRMAKEKVSVVYEGVDSAFFTPWTAQDLIRLRAELGLSDQKIMLCAGRVDPHKNIEGTLHLFAEFKKRSREPWILLKAGCPFTPLQKSMIRDLGIEPDVCEKSRIPQSKMPGLYQICHGVIFLSWYEGFGFPLVEAMASGVPALVSNRGSLPEIAADGAAISDPSDQAACLEALERLADDEDYRSRVIAKGKSRARDFSWEKTAFQTLAIYRKVLADD